MWIVDMELHSCHSSAAQTFEVNPRFLEKFVLP